MIQFAILSEARSGTSFLTSALSLHPQVLMHGEIFHPEIKWHINSEVLEEINFDLSKRQENPIDFIKEIYRHNNNKLALGFKIWQSQSQEGVQYIIENKNIKKIILERQNCLASFSSRKIAHKTNIYNLTYKNSNYQTPKINFEEKRFIEYVKFCQKTFDFYKNETEKNQQDYLLLTYTDNILLENLQPVTDFLELDSSLPLKGNKIKLNQQNNMLERFVEEDREKIINCLQNLGHEEWIYENPPNS